MADSQGMTGKPLYAGIEAGGTKCICAIGHGPQDILAQTRILTTSPEQTVRGIMEFLSAAMPQGGALAGLGIASFGPAGVRENAADYGCIGKTPKPGWSGVRLRDAFLALGAPVAFDTDVNGAGIGEALFGAGRGVGTFAYVTVGTGIGVGIMHGGRPRLGCSHYEMGHIYPPRGPGPDIFAGTCPFHGDCLEGLASGPAIMARWGDKLEDLSKDHPAFALEAHYLAHLCVTLVQCHAAERIILGGGVMHAPGLMQLVREKTQALLGEYPGPASGCTNLDGYIVKPELGDQAGITGALAMAVNVAKAQTL